MSNISNVKDLLSETCSAIREKDGTTAPINHVDIPDRIRGLSTGGGNAVGTAVAENVLQDKTFSNSTANGITGTMTNNGAKNYSVLPGRSVPIAKGYHNGQGAASCPANSDTFAFGEESDGSVIDLGASNLVRYVDATNVFEAGKASAAPERVLTDLSYMFNSEDKFNNMDQLLTLVKLEGVTSVKYLFSGHMDYCIHPINVDEMMDKLSPYLSKTDLFTYHMFEDASIDISTARRFTESLQSTYNLYAMADIHGGTVSQPSTLAADLSNCTDIRYMFYHCSGSNFYVDFSGNANLRAEYAFANSSVEKIRFREGINISTINVMCMNNTILQYFDCYNCAPTNGNQAFSNCKKLLRLTGICLNNLSSQSSIELGLETCPVLCNVSFGSLDGKCYIGNPNKTTVLTLKMPPDMSADDLVEIMDNFTTLVGTSANGKRYMQIAQTTYNEIVPYNRHLDFEAKGYHLNYY